MARINIGERLTFKPEGNDPIDLRTCLASKTASEVISGLRFELSDPFTNVPITVFDKSGRRTWLQHK